jgi:glycosyltransferase involved in cell wall biosynthesis
VTDLVVLSLERWDRVWRRNQHLVAGLLGADPDLRVLFVEPAADPTHDVASRRRPSFGSGITEVGEAARGRLWTFRPTKWLPRRLDAQADARLASAVVGAVESLGMRHPLLWINDPGAVGLAERTGWPTVYDVTDDWLAADRPASDRARAAANEERLLTVAREVVVCSPELALRKGAARPVVLIPNAVDADAYRRPAPRPADLPAGRVALYLGTVHPDRVDVDLCEATAQALGDDGTLVLVGPNLLGADATGRLSAARRRARRAARRHAVHRQPRPHQALRVPGGRPSGRLDAGGGVPGCRRSTCHDRGPGRVPDRSGGCASPQLAVPARRRRPNERLERAGGGDGRGARASGAGRHWIR